MASFVDVILVATLAGGATGIGAIPSLFTDRVSHRAYDSSLGLAAGIMFGAAVFALIVPALELGSLWEVVAGILLGGLFLLVANHLLPHLHLVFNHRSDADPGGAVETDGAVETHGPIETSGPVDTGGREQSASPLELAAERDGLRKAMLVGSAVTIHNVPEGLAVGIAFASGEEAVGIALAIAIAVQNVPDGFAMAIPAVRAGVSAPKTLLYTTLSGGVPEPIAAAFGFGLVAIVTGIFPVAAGFAAGAMMAVIFREMIPSSHGHGYADTATVTFVVGFALMMVIDTALAV